MSETLRDQLIAARDQVVGTDAPAETTPAETTPAPAQEQQAQETPKPGRTAGRERDASGKLLPGPAKRDTGQVAPQGATAAPAAPPPAAKPRPSYPSTWKRDYQ